MVPVILLSTGPNTENLRAGSQKMQITQKVLQNLKILASGLSKLESCTKNLFLGGF